MCPVPSKSWSHCSGVRREAPLLSCSWLFSCALHMCPRVLSLFWQGGGLMAMPCSVLSTTIAGRPVTRSCHSACETLDQAVRAHKGTEHMAAGCSMQAAFPIVRLPACHGFARYCKLPSRSRLPASRIRCRLRGSVVLCGVARHAVHALEALAAVRDHHEQGCRLLADRQAATDDDHGSYGSEQCSNSSVVGRQASNHSQAFLPRCDPLMGVCPI